MAKDGDEIKAVLFLIGAGGFLVFAGLKRLRRKRIVEDTASIDISSAPQGQVEIQGYAWPQTGHSLTLGGRKALYHRLVLEKYVKRDKNSSWEHQWSKTHSQPFYVLDRTGVVRVSPSDAEIEVGTITTEWGSLSPEKRDMAGRYGIMVSGFPPSPGLLGLFSSRFRFRESYILLGAPVYLHGTLSAGREEELPASLPLQRFREFLGRMGGKRLAQHTAFDLDKDGDVEAEEVSDAVNRIGEDAWGDKKAYKEQPPLPNERPAENRIFGTVTSCSERKLYIADCHQEHLLQRIGRWNFLMIVGGALMIGAGAFIVALKFLR